MAVVTTTSLPSPCSTALTRMLRRMRSTRRRSASAKQPVAGSRNSMRLPRRSASCCASSAERRTRSHTSTSSASRVAAPASNRLISSRSTSSDSNRSSWLCSSSTDRPAAASSSARTSKSRSAAILMVDSGVLSSCDTSETNCRCTLDRSSSSRSLPCRLAAISLNDVARAARSSTPCTCIRSPRCPADTRWAASAACRTGSTTHRVTSEAIAASSTMTARATPTRTRCTSIKVACCWVNGNT